MTGRDLIVYILNRGLENEPIIKDGKFYPENIGLTTIEQAAMKYNVGTRTIQAWYIMNKIDGVVIDGKVYIFRESKRPTEDDI